MAGAPAAAEVRPPRRRPGRPTSRCGALLATAAALHLAALPVAECAPKGPASIVLLGPSGAGKSETGNTLLGSGLFNVSGGLESETIVPQAHLVDFDGRMWQVVDTPGYFDTTRTPEEMGMVWETFSDIISDHIAALAFVVPYGRFGDSHLRAWRLMRGAFGARAVNHTLLLFTSCGNKTEEDVRQEMSALCLRTPPPLLCGVLEELGGVEVMESRVIALGALEPDRRERDRRKVFALAQALKAASGGRGYDHSEFRRAKARRRLMSQRIYLLESVEDRRELELLFRNLEAGAVTDGEVLRRLEEAEGGTVTRFVTLDFEDRTLGTMQQVGTGWRQPMPVPYVAMRDYSIEEYDGGELFLHTGSDSGVRLRNGEERTGELRTAPFVLGRGEITWQGTGAGGFIAVCPADAGEDMTSCLEQRLLRQSTTLVRHSFAEEDLVHFAGLPVFLRLVDDQKRGWAFVAVDDLVYPVMDQQNSTGADGDTTTAAADVDASTSTDEGSATADAGTSTTEETLVTTTTTEPPLELVTTAPPAPPSPPPAPFWNDTNATNATDATVSAPAPDSGVGVS